MEGCIVKAIYDFPKEADSDLGFYVGDVIKVTKQINAEWCCGVTGGETGQFPIAFVDIVLKDAPEKVFSAVANFVGEEEGDISFNHGDIIGLKEEVNEDWVIGKTDSSEGLCPKSFLKALEFKSDAAVVSNEPSVDCDIETVAYGESIDAFNAQSGDELTFPKGERITLVREIDSFWTEGIYNGKKGKFPSLFVKVVIPLPNELQMEDSGLTSEVAGVPNEATPCAKALYLYVGASSDELSFDRGDIITLLEKVDEQWYKGGIGKSVGLFPANHVDVIVDLPFELIKVPEKSKQEVDRRFVKSQEGKIGETEGGKGAKAVPKVKPLTKPKPSTAAKTPEGTTKTKPLLLKSSRQNQKLQGLRPKAEENNNLKEKVFEDKKLGQVEKEDRKASNESLSIKGKKNPKRPNRPPKRLEPNEQSKTDVKERSNLISNAKPAAVEQVSNTKNVKPPKKASIIENDMPLLGSNKHAKRPEARQNPSTQLVSPNVKLLEAELSSLDQNIESKSVSSSVFYLSNDQQPPLDVNVEKTSNRDSKTIKRAAPKRPNSHPSRDVPSPSSKQKADNGVSAAKLGVVDNVKKQSPSSSPKLSGIINNGRHTNGSNRKSLPPVLPKPLAPRPPKKPPVSPRTPKAIPNAVQEGAALQQPQFHPSTNGHTVSGCNEGLVGFEEFKADESNTSIFYVDFLANDSIDEKDGRADDEEIDSVEKKIVFIQGQIESESNMLSGIANLLQHSEDDESRTELISRQRTLSSSLLNLNEELYAYQDEKSYLLASIGDLNAIKSRIEDLSRQIESYKDNSAKLRRMKDVAKADELAEIKDGIEFCDNMVETLLDETAALKSKIEMEGDKQREDPAEVKRKLLNQRQKAIKELIETEKAYHRDIDLCSKQILPQLKKSKAIDCETLFGNLTEICLISSELLEALRKIDTESQEGDNAVSMIGQCFSQICYQLEKGYSSYCRNYDESQILLEKLEQDAERRGEIFNAVATLRDETGLWDLSSYLIKPVQRVLKYPLILQEIYKFSPEEDPNRESIHDAILTLRKVATAINEFKRRKDIVQKYQKTERIGNKIQRLNWHSVRKKSSRINQKITQYTGLNSQTVDESFIEEEKRFRLVEKLIKNFIRNIALYLELFQESNAMQKTVAEDIKILCNEASVRDEVDSFCTVIMKIKDVMSPKFVSAVKSSVYDPLDRLLQMFQSPCKLIEKREDKCLDYDRLMNRVQKNKDADKSKQFNDELMMARNNYEALNCQLLEELPRLTEKSIQFFKSCLATFVEARRVYLSELTGEIKLVIQFHLIERCSNAEVTQKHAESLFSAAEKISQLQFYPEKLTAYDGPMKSDPLTLSRETFSNFYVDMLFETNENDSTAVIKPSSSDPNEAEQAHQIETRPVPLPRRRSLRRSSNSHSYIQAKSHGTTLDTKATETKGERKSPLSGNGILNQMEDLYVVEYSFQKEDPAEISVEEGMVVKVIRKYDKEANPEWWLIETPTGRGYIPANYLSPHEKVAPVRMYDAKENGTEITEHVKDCVNETSKKIVDNGNHKFEKEKERWLNSANSVADSNSNGKSTGTLRKGSQDCLYRALYDFVGTEEGESALSEGEIVRVLKFGDDSGNNEWCYVERNGSKGYVPANYLEPLK